MDQVFLQAGATRYGPISDARTFWQRWRGLKSLPAGAAVLIRTSSVHGFAVGAPFRAVGLTQRFQVAATQVVEPGRVAKFPGCRYVLELPLGAEAPEPGVMLELRRV
ncbi:MAG: hypothetical protein V3U46_00145 [Acidimicrobiia bacterium]